ncbi:MAG TPA: IS481 family transposase [Candidatus Limnocylindrales bacterium]|nr:IS481 family transposase [Candidatus Limnocylindrales bacterium]
MSRARVAVLQIVSKQLTVTAAAAEYGISRRHLHRLLARYREGGLDALEPRSRRPKTTPIATSETVRQRVIELRGQLTADGLDAGPVTIGWHLEREGLRALSTSTIRRILHAAGLICAEPRKRPRSSYVRFEMAQPNEMWQSDFIHWRLADETDVEVLSWLDDHSRYLLSCTAHEPVSGDDVVTVFLGLIDQYGTPASTLTDNGSVYTSRFTGGRNAFEYVLALLGIRQKNGSPGHPQTQGKTERFHQTLQRWLRARPTARTLAELQQQLDAFREHYNERRPHRALNRGTPGDAYRATPKAAPASNGHPQGHYRLRYDRLDTKGRMTLRRAGRMHHLHTGVDHARKRVLAFADDHEVTVADLTTGEVLSIHQIQPEKTYWRNEMREPGRWPSSQK